MLSVENCENTVSGLLCKLWKLVLKEVGIEDLENLKVLIYNGLNEKKDLKKLKLNNLHTTLTARSLMWKSFIYELFYYLDITEVKFTILITDRFNKRNKIIKRFRLSDLDKEKNPNQYLSELFSSYFKRAKLSEYIYQDIYNHCNAIADKIKRNNKKASLFRDLTTKNLTWEKFNFLLIDILRIKEYTIIMNFNYDGKKHRIIKKTRIGYEE